MARSITPQRTRFRQPTPDEIAHVAFHLSLHRGQIQGYEAQDWNRAEQLLRRSLRRMDPSEPPAIPHSAPSWIFFMDE